MTCIVVHIDTIIVIMFLFYRMADDLFRLLQATVGKSQVILVGADFSSLIARFYTQLYEE